MTLQYQADSVGVCCSELTVLIPTKDRPDELACAFEFYSDRHAPYRFVVLDASNATIREINQRLFERLDLAVEYHVFDDNVGVVDRIREALRSCETDLVLMAADDDFIFPEAIDKAICFLQEHADYSACHGRAYSIAVKDFPSHDDTIDLTVSEYYQRAFENGDSLARFFTYVRNWSTMAYSVQRRVLMSEAFEHFTMLDNDTRFMEFYWYAYLLLMGKVRRLDELYMVRQLNLRKHWTVDEVGKWAETKVPLLLPVVVELLSQPLGASRVAANACLRRYCEEWVLSRQRFRPQMLYRYPWWYFSYKLRSKLRRYAKVGREDKMRMFEIFSRLCRRCVGSSSAGA
jgi:glycosyltransferase domain-containing protein